MADTRCLPDLTLHVFEQDAGWHWGLTISRANGNGSKVIAFNQDVFDSEAAARADGEEAYRLARAGGMLELAMA
ncbi:hypothetical protein [Paraburkholderia sp.]|uniref:hypothetical protein n=1 Tax=Paraburkholderia sp. TaxID=1926495 RepID=UPI002389DDB3|nr:hypothetical protein [Paraburkholderia sp.]MDE1179900.1 hypothetical protein [Paraburkholderia sp.]